MPALIAMATGPLVATALVSESSSPGVVYVQPDRSRWVRLIVNVCSYVWTGKT